MKLTAWQQDIKDRLAWYQQGSVEPCPGTVVMQDNGTITISTPTWMHYSKDKEGWKALIEKHLASRGLTDYARIMRFCDTTNFMGGHTGFEVQLVNPRSKLARLLAGKVYTTEDESLYCR